VVLRRAHGRATPGVRCAPMLLLLLLLLLLS
jgi:hypothetical protein